MIPELLLWLIYLSHKPFVDRDGLPHQTDAALGFAIYSFIACGLRAALLLIDAVLLFIRNKKSPGG